MIGKSAKLQWGLGHKSLKTVYEGALIPLLTSAAPILSCDIPVVLGTQDSEGSRVKTQLIRWWSVY
jgi:hypothetical protein